MHAIRITFILAAVGLFSVSRVQAAMISLPVVVDGEGRSINDFNTIDSFDTTGLFLLVDKSGPNGTRAAFEFDISSLSLLTDPIVSASLVVYITVADLLIGVHAGTGDGIITEADFLFDGLITQFDPNSAFPPVENVVDVTSFIQANAGVDSMVVFQLRELFDDERNEIVSRNSSQLSWHPRLDIVTVPEPGTVTLVGLGVVGLLAIVRRKK